MSYLLGSNKTSLFLTRTAQCLMLKELLVQYLSEYVRVSILIITIITVTASLYIVDTNIDFNHCLNYTRCCKRCYIIIMVELQLLFEAIRIRKVNVAQ